MYHHNLLLCSTGHSEKQFKYLYWLSRITNTSMWLLNIDIPLPVHTTIILSEHTPNLFPHSSKCCTSRTADWSQWWGCGRCGDCGNFCGGHVDDYSCCCRGYDVAEKTSENRGLCYIWVSLEMCICVYVCVFGGAVMCLCAYLKIFLTKANLIAHHTNAMFSERILHYSSADN